GVDANGVFFQPSTSGPEFLIHKVSVETDAHAFGRFGFLDVFAEAGPNAFVIDPGVGLRLDINASAPDGRLRFADLEPTSFFSALDFSLVDANPATNDLVVALDVEASSNLPGQDPPIHPPPATPTLTWPHITNITNVQADFSPRL